MLRNKLKQGDRKAGGFTIIEVLIVLAIAGLIMLIVFLAVPQLQRNAHNTQRRNDVASVLGAWSEYTNNNGGTLPGAWDKANSQFKAASGSSNPAPVKLGFYDPADLSLAAYSSNPTVSDADKAVIVKGASCNSTSTALASGSSRSVAVLFMLEGGAVQCQSS